MSVYEKVCEDIAGFHEHILAVGVVKDAGFLASRFRELVFKPKAERLSVMLGQAQLMTSIPQTNEDFFGKTRMVMVLHDNLHSFMFPISHDKRKERLTTTGLAHDLAGCVLTLILMPPYNNDEIVTRVLDYLNGVNLCTHSD